MSAGVLVSRRSVRCSLAEVQVLKQKFFRFIFDAVVGFVIDLERRQTSRTVDMISSLQAWSCQFRFVLLQWIMRCVELRGPSSGECAGA